MRKSLLILVTLTVLFACLGVVSASDVNDTEDLADTTIVSQDDSVATANSDSQIKLDKKEDKTTSDEKSSSSDSENGDDCCSAIIQGYNNNSAISFRRDSTGAVTLNVTHNSTIVKQCKGSGSYFYHVLVSKDGWLVGNGGVDDATVCRSTENYAISMINNNKIDNVTFNKICNLKKNSVRSHFVIKAPNGDYALYINYYGNTKKQTGKLLAGQYLEVPNDPTYFNKGYFSNVVSTTNLSTASRIIAAKNKYNVNRRDIITYYYKNYNTYSEVKIYACNDDGRYVNKSTANLVDSIRTNTKLISYKNIPAVPNSIVVDNIRFTLKKVNTVIKCKNITTNNPNMTLVASVLDANGNKVNSGYVSVKVNDKTLTYSNGSTIYLNVKNGTVSLKVKVGNLWKRSNYTYEFRYYGDSLYKESSSNKAVIYLRNLVNLKNIHSSTTTYGTNITMTASVTYKLNNSKVGDGKVVFKISGKTIKNADGSSVIVNVKNGVATYTLPLNEKYSPRSYNITVVYSNGFYREEVTNSIKINKIVPYVVLAKYLIRNNKITIAAKLVDKQKKLIPFESKLGVKINGKTLKDAKGNTQIFKITNGTIKFTFTLPKLKEGNHTVTLVIPELRAHLSVRKNITINV
jgi:hypothetical protein